MLERAYARFGLAYIVPLLVAAVVVSAADVSSFTIIGLRFLDVTSAEASRILRIALIGSNIGLAFAFGLLVIFMRPTLSWMLGDRTPERAPAAWIGATVGLPRVIYLGVVFVGLGDLPAIALSASISGMDMEIAFVVIAAGAATLAGGLILLIMSEAWLRPVVNEIGDVLEDVPSVKRRPFGRRIVVFIVLVSFLSPFYAMGVSESGVTGSERLVGAITVSAAIALTFGVLISFVVARSITAPVEGLLRVTRSVSRGELDAGLVPASNDEIGELVRSFNEMVDGLREREALHSALGTYVDPVVADRLLREGQVLEGEEVDATIMFVDIVGYTTRVESMEPADVVAELNRFFQLLIPIVNRHGGHTNKLLGDGLMAVFGAPVITDDHADRALAAAVEIQGALGRRYEETMPARIGLNSGRVVVGTTGAASKLDFTVMGDAVNVAQRVEALTRETGDRILITEETRERLSNSDHALIPRGQTTVKGRVAPVQTYAALVRRHD